MMLYHGTYEENVENIIKDGYIDNKKSLEDTLIIDKIISEYMGKLITNNAVYLTDDIMCTQLAYDFEFKVDVSQLDTKLLYVADNSLRDEILAYGNDCKEGIKAIEDYVKSFVLFDEYIANQNKYNNPEYLYFDKIYINKNIQSF